MVRRLAVEGAEVQVAEVVAGRVVEVRIAWAEGAAATIASVHNFGLRSQEQQRIVRGWDAAGGRKPLQRGRGGRR